MVLLDLHFALDFMEVFAGLLDLITLQLEIVDCLSALVLGTDECVVLLANIFLGYLLVFFE